MKYHIIRRRYSRSIGERQRRPLQIRARRPLRPAREQSQCCGWAVYNRCDSWISPNYAVNRNGRHICGGNYETFVIYWCSHTPTDESINTTSIYPDIALRTAYTKCCKWMPSKVLNEQMSTVSWRPWTSRHWLERQHGWRWNLDQLSMIY